ncbi:hypothetical protein CQ10_37640 [Bradyrhizobium valentinum]|nr:hypothetical protein CQ10_37640 [Bradyrhizobium valentinum]
MFNVITTKLERLNAIANVTRPGTMVMHGQGMSTQTVGQPARFKSASHASAEIRHEAYFHSAVRNALFSLRISRGSAGSAFSPLTRLDC